MKDLFEILASIDSAVADPNESDGEQALTLMEEAADLPGGIMKLVNLYGGREESSLLRPLTFVVARMAAGSTPQRAYEPTLDIIGRLRCRDETARANIATALHLLAIHQRLDRSDPRTRGLANFFFEALTSGSFLRDAALPSLVVVLTAGIQVNEQERHVLRGAVEQMRAESPEWATLALGKLVAPRER